jgi:hypothetical protein
MLTVTVSINGSPVITRTCSIDPCRSDITPEGSFYVYMCDDGRDIIHRYEDGDAVLASKLLEGVRKV